MTNCAARWMPPNAYAGELFVPTKARWMHIRDQVHDSLGDGLNEALMALEKDNAATESVNGFETTLTKD